MTGIYDTAEHWAGIIRASGESERTLLALSLLLAATAIVIFFRKSRLWARFAGVAMLLIAGLIFSLASVSAAIVPKAIEFTYHFPGPYRVDATTDWGRMVTESELRPAQIPKETLAQAEEIQFDAAVVEESAEPFPFDIELAHDLTADPLVRAGTTNFVEARTGTCCASHFMVGVWTNYGNRRVGTKDRLAFTLRRAPTGGSALLNVKGLSPQRTLVSPSDNARLIFWSLAGGGPHFIVLRDVRIKIRANAWPWH